MDSEDMARQPKPIGQHPYAGFLSFMTLPAGSELLLKNVRLWREGDAENVWFMEPLPLEAPDTGWTKNSFPEPVTSELYHRGPLNFTSSEGARRIERRATVTATEFGDSKEKSILDLGHYIGGISADGSIVFQAGVGVEFPS